MAAETIVFYVVIALGIVIAGATVYIYVRNRSLNEIMADVYQLFLEAERVYTESGSGKQKMAWVISKARGLLPDWAKIFITDEVLNKVIEEWFKAVKDLLDDGKYNKSV